MAEIEIVDLKKKVTQVLEAKGVVSIPPVRVGIALDISGSTNTLYYSGQVQRLLEILFPVALRLDDNGQMELGLFGNSFTLKQDVTMDNYADYISTKVYPRGTHFDQSTYYAPVFEGFLKHYFQEEDLGSKLLGKVSGFFGKKKQVSNKDLPATVFMVTDGKCFDEEAAEHALIDSKAFNVFWILVGVGRIQEFAFLTKMANKYDHVDFQHFPDMNMSPDTMYNKVLSTEYCTWLKGR